MSSARATSCVGKTKALARRYRDGQLNIGSWALGSPRCWQVRQSPVGCLQCMRRCPFWWHFVHQISAAAVGGVATAGPGAGVTGVMPLPLPLPLPGLPPVPLPLPLPWPFPLPLPWPPTPLFVLVFCAQRRCSRV